MAVALAMDAFAVAIVEGGACRRLHLKYAFKVALLFGGFQALMPIVGYFCGLTIRHYVVDWANWIAFGLLLAMGMKMIYESTKLKTDNKQNAESRLFILIALSIATSIDALAVGITLSLVQNVIFFPALLIGIITFILSYVGVYIGQRFGHFFENRIEAAGGIILVALAIKILLKSI